MGLRLVGKSIKLAMRSRRRFIAFTLMYTVLMAWMAYNWESFLYDQDTASIWDDPQQILMLGISIAATLILSVIYAWIVINYRRKEIATLKCIGYTNANIRTIIIGELVWVTFIAFIIVAEVLIHVTAAITYFYSQEANTPSDLSIYLARTKPFLSIWPITITLGMFLFAQIVGILLMYSKILKLRPIVALRVLK